MTSAQPSPQPSPQPSQPPATGLAALSEAAKDASTAAALQDVLAAEHAAVWSYSLIVAFLPPELDKPATDGAEAHRTRRTEIEALLTAAGVRPVPAEPAYRTPQPVTDRASALELAVAAESDTAAAWHSVLERSNDAALRKAAVVALTDDTVRLARWRQLAGKAPAVPPFPGQP
jgi:hypothetical protein